MSLILAGTVAQVGPGTVEGRPAAQVSGVPGPLNQPAVVTRGAERRGQMQLADPPDAPATGPGANTAGADTTGCVVVDPAPANRWRAEHGLPPLLVSGELISASCAWSQELLRRGQLIHGAMNEVLYMSIRTPGDPFAAWRASPNHFTLLVTSRSTTTHIGCAQASGTRADGVAVYYTTCRMNW